MRANFVLTLASGLLLAQCASKPAEIKAVYIAPSQYQSYTCPQLAQQAEALSAKADELSRAQDQRSINASLPFFGGDGQAATTRLTLIKGQLNAIEQTRTYKKCR
jgi:hypothetical protein